MRREEGEPMADGQALAPTLRHLRREKVFGLRMVVGFGLVEGGIGQQIVHGVALQGHWRALDEHAHDQGGFGRIRSAETTRI